MGQSASANAGYVVEIAPPKIGPSSGRGSTHASNGAWDPIPQEESPKKPHHKNGHNSMQSPKTRPLNNVTTKQPVSNKAPLSHRGYEKLKCSNNDCGVITAEAPPPWRIIVNPRVELSPYLNNTIKARKMDGTQSETGDLGERNNAANNNAPTTPNTTASRNSNSLLPRQSDSTTSGCSSGASPSTSTGCTPAPKEDLGTAESGHVANSEPLIDRRTLQEKCVGSGNVHLPKLQLAAAMQGFSSTEYRQKLTGTVDRLYGSSNRLINQDEAHALVLLLEPIESPDTLLRTLTVISNLAAFQSNQDLLRERGCIKKLKLLLKDEKISVPVRVMLMQAVSNMAVNQKNFTILQDCVPILCDRLCGDSASELEKAVCMQALTNLCLDIRSEHVYHLSETVPVVLDRLWCQGQPNIATLRLMVNFSCCSAMVPYILAAKSPCGLISICDCHQADEILTRSVSFVCNLTQAIDSQALSWPMLAPLRADCRMPKSDSVYFACTGAVGVSELQKRLRVLAQHSNDEISGKARRILSTIAANSRRDNY